MKILIVSLYMLATTVAFAQNNKTGNYKEGDVLPNMVLTNLDDSVIETDVAYKDKGLVLIFYKGVWSKPCLEQMHELDAYRKELLRHNYVLCAITTQPTDLLKELQLEHKYKLTMLHDEAAAAITKLGNGQAFIPIPTIMIVDKNHVIRYIYMNTNALERVGTEEIMEKARQIQPELITN